MMVGGGRVGCSGGGGGAAVGVKVVVTVMVVVAIFERHETLQRRRATTCTYSRRISARSHDLAFNADKPQRQPQAAESSRATMIAL